jgi:D-alanyl-D-alanine carboxypeptidase (penicillin-binding protein 5/6)
MFEAISGGLPTPPHISAKTAILVDPDSGRILFSRKANDHVPMASTAKIMTALVVLEHLPLDAKITVSQKAVETIGSGVGLQVGESLTVEQLLNALLIRSGNDAAVALAEGVAGSVEDFVDLMNEKAAALELKNTHFRNPHGMNTKGNYSSARDLATITAAAFEDETFAAIVDTETYILPRPDGTSLILENSNKLLHDLPWVTGVKTGSTPLSGGCLVSSGNRGGISLIAVVLGESDYDKRWEDCQELLEYGFSLYRRVLVVTRGDSLFEVAVPFRPDDPLDVVAARTLVVPVFMEDEVRTSVRAQKVRWPVEAGEPLGSLAVTVAGETVDSIDLVAGGAVDSPSLAATLGDLTRSLPPGIRLAQVLRPAEE